MQFLFCKKSVFSILFLISFLLGTICGILLFRFVYELHHGWIVDYGYALSQSSVNGGILTLFFALVPFVLLFLLALFDEGYRLAPVLAAIRGCLLSYYLSCCFVSGVGGGVVLFRNLMLLPVFYLLSRHIWVYRPFDREKL